MQYTNVKRKTKQAQWTFSSERTKKLTVFATGELIASPMGNLFAES
jgi:hypothetical protein